jgi:hypothetical protein
MSSARHAVTRAEIFRDFGYLPSFTPAHQLDLLIGKGPPGAIIDFKRTRPVVGKCAIGFASGLAAVLFIVFSIVELLALVVLLQTQRQGSQRFRRPPA